MKKWLSIAMVFLMSFPLFGCVGSKTDVLVGKTQSDPMPYQQSFSYDIDLGHKVQQANVSIEYWQAGKLIDQASLELDDKTSNLAVTFNLESLSTEKAEKLIDVQMNTESSDGENHDVLMRRFFLPEGASGYTFEGSDDKQQIKVAPNDERILGGIAFDIGRGVHGIGLDGLIEEPESIKEYDAIVIVRAQFE